MSLPSMLCYFFGSFNPPFYTFLSPQKGVKLQLKYEAQPSQFLGRSRCRFSVFRSTFWKRKKVKPEAPKHRVKQRREHQEIFVHKLYRSINIWFYKPSSIHHFCTTFFFSEEIQLWTTIWWSLPKERNTNHLRSQRVQAIAHLFPFFISQEKAPIMEPPFITAKQYIYTPARMHNFLISHGSTSNIYFKWEKVQNKIIDIETSPQSYHIICIEFKVALFFKASLNNP